MKTYIVLILLLPSILIAGEILKFEDSFFANSMPMSYSQLVGHVDLPPIPKKTKFLLEYRFHQSFDGENTIYLWETEDLAAIVMSTDEGVVDQQHQIFASKKYDNYRRLSPTYGFSFIEPEQLKPLKDLLFGQEFQEYSGKLYTTNFLDGYAWLVRAVNNEQRFEVAFENFFFDEPENVVHEALMEEIAKITMASTENYYLSKWAESIKTLPPMRINTHGTLKLYRNLTSDDIPLLINLFGRLQGNSVSVDLSNVEGIEEEVYDMIVELSGSRKVYWILNDRALTQLSGYGFNYTQYEYDATSHPDSFEF